MTEWRFRLALGLGCAFFTAVACGGGDEATNKGKPWSMSSAGTGGQTTAPPAGQGGATTSAGAGTIGAGTSGTGSVPAECSDNEPLLCTDDQTLRLCSMGEYQSAACSELCDAVGLTKGGCDLQVNQCDCGEPLDPPCFYGADVLCFCVGTCTNEEFFNFYASCLNGTNEEVATVLPCLSEQIVEDASGEASVDCEAAAIACIPGAAEDAAMMMTPMTESGAAGAASDG